MNKKLIAAAVSAAIVAPVAAYGEITVYGRINNAIDLNDLDDSADADSKTDLSSVSSRFGIKYNKEIGNGLSAHGRYEFATATDRELHHKGGGGTQDVRIATVGLSGPFGRIDAGNQWSSYFNTFGTLVSPTYTLGYYIYSSIGGAPYRSSNTIKYSNSFGPIYAELDIRLNEDGGEGGDTAEVLRGDGVGLGLSWAINDNFTIAAAWDAEEGADIAAVKGVNAIVTNDYDPGNEEERDEVIVDVLQGNGEVTETTFSEVTTTGSDAPAGRIVTEGVDAVVAGEESDTDRFGIGVKANFGGGYWLSVGWQNLEEDDNGKDIDSTFIYGGGNFSEKTNWLLGYSEADIDGSDADDPEQLTWGVYHNIGGGLKIYYEAMDVDNEGAGQDGARHLIGMRVDF